MGNPRRARDNAAIEEAARMGGASELIARLPDGFDTYLERPVRDEYHGLPDETRVILGRKVVKGPEGYKVEDSTNQELSGGQRQRLAVARTFMRSSTMEQEVGLLLFDEPSASLDPTAEQGKVDIPSECPYSRSILRALLLDLFSRLRKLRASKTMIFSTHRFGNLTRHADLILYVSGISHISYVDLTRHRQ